MRNHASLLVLGILAAVLIVATAPSAAQLFDIVTLSSPNEESSGNFGFSVAGTGDVNQDGFTDVIVGAWQEGPGTSPDLAGRAYVFSGQDGSLLFELISPNEEELGGFGVSVAGAGDVNLDGFADVIVGAYLEDPGTSPNGAGRAYVFSGQNGTVLFELVSPNEEQGGVFGVAVSTAGDVDQDGIADVIVGAPFEDPGNSPADAGRAYVFSGQNGTLLFELMSPNEEVFGLFGDFTSVSNAGDVNQDGYADVIVGAAREDPDTSPNEAGRAYVFSGQNGSLLFELMSPNEEHLGSFGFSVAGAGDVNQDGFADLIAAAPGEDPGTSPNDAGRAYVFSGRDGSLLVELVSPNEEQSGTFGASVSGAGDVNEDGLADVIVGSFDSPGTSPSGAGRAYVFSGDDGSLLFELNSPNEEANGSFGASVSDGGDANQDGLPDVIVGAYLEDPGTSPTDAGRAYIFVSGGGQPDVFRINSGGPNYTNTGGYLFDADQGYTPGGFGYVGGKERSFSHPIGGTEDDPLYQDLRVVRDGSFFYRFDVSAAARYRVTLYLMAPAFEGAGNVVMDVQAEGAIVIDDLDVTAEAGGAVSCAHQDRRRQRNRWHAGSGVSRGQQGRGGQRDCRRAAAGRALSSIREIATAGSLLPKSPRD